MASSIKTVAHRNPLGSGAIPPQPKRGGKESAKLVAQEIQTKPEDTALLFKFKSLACEFEVMKYS